MIRKLLFSAICLSIGFTSSAQFSVATPEGNEFTEGEVFGFGTIEDPEAFLSFLVTNTSSEDIRVKIEFVSANNADGSLMQICFGICYAQTTIGQSYPINDVVIIEPGETQPSSGDHFWNSSDGGGSPIEYAFRFYAVDENGDEIGEDLTINYLYDPALSIEDKKGTINAQLLATVVTDQLQIDAKEALTMTIYDLQGKLVQKTALDVGMNSIDVSKLTIQPYLVALSNEIGAAQTMKIIKK